MARIRTIKPETWESEKLGRLPILARLNFIGLISLADDEGRGRGDSAFLLARLHPYTQDVTPEAMQASLEILRDSGLAVFYQADGCSYYSLTGWGDNQKIDRPSASKLPAPPTAKRRLAKARDDSSKAREGSRLDQGSGIGSGIREAEPEGFTEFWATYPRKDKKQKARSLWAKLKPDGELRTRILADVQNKTASPKWRENNGEFIPMPTTYLSESRWEDEGTKLPPMMPKADDRTAAHLAARGQA